MWGFRSGLGGLPALNVVSAFLFCLCLNFGDNVNEEN